MAGAAKAKMNSSKMNSSWMAFLAAALFCMAGLLDFVLGIQRTGLFVVVGMLFFVATAIWVVVGVAFRRAENKSAPDC